MDRCRPLPNLVDQIFGTDRPVSAGARHLVGAQDLGPREAGLVKKLTALPHSREGAGVRPGLAQDFCVLLHMSGRTSSWLTTSTNSSPIANPSCRAIPARRDANRCASVSSVCSATPISSVNI